MPFANTGLAAPNNFTNSAGVFDYTSGTATTHPDRPLRAHHRHLRRHQPRARPPATSTSAAPTTSTTARRPASAAPATPPPRARASTSSTSSSSRRAAGCPATPGCRHQLTANVNINQTCNAFWSPGSAPSTSTARAAAAGTPARSRPSSTTSGATAWTTTTPAARCRNSSEGYADIAAIYRLQASCVGHGFFQTLDDGCGLTPDGTGFNTNEARPGAPHCDTDCSGVRDADWAKHVPTRPTRRSASSARPASAGTRPLRPAGALRGGARRARRPGTS